MRQTMRHITYTFAGLSLLAAINTFAGEVRVDERSRTVYYVPTPVVHVVDYDLDKEGAILNIFTEYRSQELQAEYDELRRLHPDKMIQRLGSRVAGEAVVSLPDFDMVVEAVTKMHPMGVTVAAELSLTRDQYKSFLSMIRSSGLGSVLNVKVPIKVSYQKSQVLEEYATDESTCRKFISAKTIGDVVVALNNMAMPYGMKYSSTLADLKKSILYQCFEIEPQNKIFGSLRALMDTGVLLSRDSQKLYARTVRLENIDEEMLLPYTPVRR